MELWQMDIMGGVRLKDGSELKIVTGIDEHSRFCVSALVVFRATAKPVCEALALAMRRYGVPEQILTDNGKVFTSRFGRGRGGLRPPGIHESRVLRELARLTEKKASGVTWGSCLRACDHWPVPFPQANLTSSLPELFSTRQRTTAITSMMKVRARLQNP